VSPREYHPSVQPIVYAVNRSRDICHQSRIAAGTTFPPMCSLNIDTSMRGCNSLERERNFEVDQLHSAVLTNARLVAAAIAGYAEGGNWLIHATLSSQTNLVARCLINLSPRCIRFEWFASLVSAHFVLHEATHIVIIVALFYFLSFFPFSHDLHYSHGLRLVVKEYA